MKKATAVSLIDKLIPHLPKIFFAFVLLLSLLSLVYYAMVIRQPNQNPADMEVKNITVTVGKLMLLPTDETPTVATVTDISKLVNQPFFAKAQNGDKVLFFNKAKKAILFRSSINRIVDVTTINITVPTPTQIITPTVTLSPTPLKKR
jgi:hypothetical protein